jgi:hypothetical protein
VPKKLLRRRANHLHKSNIARIKPAPGNWPRAFCIGLFESDGGRISRSLSFLPCQLIVFKTRLAAGVGQGFGTWNDRSAGWVCVDHVESCGVVLFRQARIRERRADHQAMNAMRDADIKAIVAETLAEQQRLHHNDIDAVVLRTIATILTSFGIEEEDRKELRADFQHLRRWRKSVEQAQSYTFKAVITIIVTGFVGAVWLGVKVMLGK